VAYEQDTDRVAGELLNLLKGSLTKPGGALSRPQPQADDGTMLNMIKDVLKQTLPPGTLPKQRPTKPSAPQSVPSAYQSPASSEVAVGGWEGLFRRQGQERDAMHQRHERERTEMHQRHNQELGAAMTGGTSGGSGIAAEYPSGIRREAPAIRPTRMPTSRRGIAGPDAGQYT
jgi:hypothetical protein